jgi:competence transcription factor ComK
MNPNEVLYLRTMRQGTQIVTEQQTYFIHEKAETYLETWCLAHGSSLRGSADVARHHLKAIQKLPVLVNPYGGLYFFPTLSRNHPECVWINVAQIRKLKNLGNKTLIRFRLEELELDIGIRSIRMQMKRCCLLKDRLGKTLLAPVAR